MRPIPEGSCPTCLGWSPLARFNHCLDPYHDPATIEYLEWKLASLDLPIHIKGGDQ